MSHLKEESKGKSVLSLTTTTGLKSMIEAHLYYEELQSGLESILILGGNVKEMWRLVDWHRFILAKWIELKKQGHRGPKERWIPMMNIWINVIDAVVDLVFNYALPLQHCQSFVTRESLFNLIIRNMLLYSSDLPEEDEALWPPILKPHERDAWFNSPRMHGKPFRKLVTDIRRTIQSNIPEERLQLQRQRGIESSDFQNFIEEIEEKIKELIALSLEEEQKDLYCALQRALLAAIEHGYAMDLEYLWTIRSLIDTWFSSKTALRQDLDWEFQNCIQDRFAKIITPWDQDPAIIEELQDAIALGADIRGSVEEGRMNCSLWAAAGYSCPIGLFQALVDAGAPYTMDSFQGQSPLQAAIEHDNPDIAAFLLSGKNHSFQIDVNDSDASGKSELDHLFPYSRNADSEIYLGMTALHTAARSCSRTAVDLLFQNSDIDANAQDADGNTPLLLAIQAVACPDKYAILRKFLRNKRVDCYCEWASSNVLHCAASWRDATLSIVLRHVRNINVNAPNSHGETALHLAVKADSRPNVGILLRHGADPTVLNAWGSTPLQLACEARLLGPMKELLSLPQSLVKQWPLPVEDLSIEHEARVARNHGSPVTLVLRRLRNAFESENNHLKLALKLILEAKPNLEFRDENGRSVLSVLSLVCWMDDQDILLDVLRAGANVNSQDDNGDSPLHLLLSRDGNVEGPFKILLEWGADPDITNKQGQTAITANSTHCPKEFLEDMVKQHKLKIAEAHRQRRKNDNMRKAEAKPKKGRQQNVVKTTLRTLSNPFSVLADDE